MERNVSDWERGVSIAAGALLVVAGLKARGRMRNSLVSSGAGMAFRGLSGYCPINQLLGRTIKSDDTREALGGSGGVKLQETVTIRRSARELYDLWHTFDALPRIFSHIESVRPVGLNRTHWVMRGPAGIKLEWEAETINEVAPELIAWKSLPGSTVVSAGSVHFREMTSGGVPETEVTVEMQYAAPAGRAGSIVAWLAGESPAKTLREDLAGLKHRLELVEGGVSSAVPAH